jgi:hypothetical protein
MSFARATVRFKPLRSNFRNEAVVGESSASSSGAAPWSHVDCEPSWM